MKKTYVLDTNVILYAPNAILSFGDNDVIIPEVVLEELDSFKKDKSDLGANARYAARLIDKLRNEGKLNEGIELENGGRLRVEMNHYDTKIPSTWSKDKADNRILQVCKPEQLLQYSRLQFQKELKHTSHLYSLHYSLAI